MRLGVGPDNHLFRVEDLRHNHNRTEQSPEHSATTWGQDGVPGRLGKGRIQYESTPYR